MPELPDIELYLHALRQRILGHRLDKLHIMSPFVLRTFEPPVEAIQNKAVNSIERIGKRVAFCFDDELFLVVHLMIAGRFRWSEASKTRLPRKIALVSFEFEVGTLHLVESSQKKRAGLWLVQGRDALEGFDPGGLDVLKIDLREFTERFRSENHTVKRSLTDPRLFDGIGNAYSDEILHAAKLSPVKLTQSHSDEEIDRLFNAAREVLSKWIETLRFEFSRKFPGPGDITAFRPEFAVHGKFGQPCPVCGTKVQRIRYAENETNYCPRCQTGGKLLADRSLSRLLKKDWPATIEELEEQRNERQ